MQVAIERGCDPGRVILVIARGRLSAMTSVRAQGDRTMQVAVQVMVGVPALHCSWPCLRVQIFNWRLHVPRLQPDPTGAAALPPDPTGAADLGCPWGLGGG